MPVFEVELSDGTTLDVQADREPTLDEVYSAMQSRSGAGEVISPAQVPPPQPTAMGTFGRAAATSIAPSAAAAAAFGPGFSLGAPYAPATYGIAPFATGAAAALAAAYGGEKLQRWTLGKVAPGFLKQQEIDAEKHALAAAAGRITGMAPAFVVAPGQTVKGIAALPKIVRGVATEAERRAAIGTAAQFGAQAGITTAQSAITEGKLPTAAQMSEAMIAAAIYGHPRRWLGGPTAGGLLAPPKAKETYAAQERLKQEGRVPEHPGVEEVGLPPEAGGRYSPESAARLEEKAQVLLKPAQEQNARLGLGQEFDWVDNFGPEDPEHYRLMKSSAAQVDADGNFVAPGRISISRASLEAFMRETAPELQQRAFSANFAEEGIHGFVTPKEAAAYEATLSSVEKSIGYRLYRRGAAKAEVPMSPDLLGQELLRQRLQQLLRLEISETADLAGRQRWSAKSLEFIANIVRRIREWIGTNAATEGQGISKRMLDRIDQNVEAAKRAVAAEPGGFEVEPAAGLPEPAVSETEPFARRRMVRGYEFDPDIADKDVQVTVMKFPMPDGTSREVVQTDGIVGGENIWSLNPELMREAGHDIPSSAEILANVPSGKYRLDAIRQMLPEKPEVSEPKEGMVRLYHGEGAAKGAGFGTTWFTKDWARAASYGDTISYVDVPADVASEAQSRARQAGSGTASDHLLSGDQARQAKDLPQRLQPRVYDVGPAARRRVEELRPEERSRWWYSRLERAVRSLSAGETKPKTGQKWKGWIDRMAAGMAIPTQGKETWRGGIAREEIDWSGIKDLLEDGRTYTRQQVVDAIRMQTPQIREVVYGAAAQEGVAPMIDALVKERTSITRRMNERLETPEFSNYQALKQRANALSAQIRTITLPETERRAATSLRDSLEEEAQRIIDEKLHEDQQKLYRVQSEIENLTRQTRPNYGGYTLRGGERYSELLLILPPESARGIEFESTHWNEKNVIAHVRFNQRRDVNNQRILFLEEAQSDLHQRGRDEGYTSEAVMKRPDLESSQKGNATVVTLGDMWVVITPEFPLQAYRGVAKNPDGTFTVRAKGVTVHFQDEAEALSWLRREEPGAEVKPGEIPEATWIVQSGPDEVAFPSLDEAKAYAELDLQERWTEMHGGSVPDFPFKDSGWKKLVLHRMLRWGAEQGYDGIAWTTGQQQIQRWNLGRHIDRLHWTYDPNRKLVFLEGTQRNTVRVHQEVPLERLPQFVGEDMTKKIVSSEQFQNADRLKDTMAFGEFTGIDLQIGGRGMIAFYDQHLPNFANNIVAKYGERVGKTKIVPGMSKFKLERKDPQTHQWILVDEFDRESTAAIARLELEQEYSLGSTREIPETRIRSNQLEVHFLKTPEAMRQAIKEEGFPLFTRRRKGEPGPELPMGPIGPGRLTQPEKAKTALEGLAEHEARMYEPVTPGALEKTSAEYFIETTAPDLGEFASRLRASYGADIKPGQVRSLFEEGLWQRLERASGKELAEMVKDLGLAKRLRLETPEGEIRKIAEPLEVEQAKALRAAEPATQPTFEAIVKTPRIGALQKPEQKFRANVIATIADKVLIRGEGSRDFLKRTDIDPSKELSDPAVQTKEPIYGEFRESDQIDPNLPDKLVQDARAFGGEKTKRVIGGQIVTVRKKGFPVSASKRLTAIQSKSTRKVYLVSSYRDGRRGPVMLDPVAPAGTHIRIEDGLNRYRVIASALLDEPVQDFKKEYKSLSDYESKFGTDARQAAERIAGYEAPEPSTQAVPYRTIRPEEVTPEESARIMEQILEELPDIESPEDIKAAWEGLEGSPQARQAISGLQKLGREVMRREPGLNEEQFLDRLAKIIYENHEKAKDFEDFQRRTMEASRAPVSEAVRLEAQRRELESERRRAAAEAARPAPAVSGARELTMPREIAPTAIRGEVLPKGEPPEPHPVGEIPVPPEMLTPEERAYVSEEAARVHPPLKRRKVVSLYDVKLPEGDHPASLRRRAIQVADESRRIKLALATIMRRREIMREFPRTLDAAENIGNNEGYRGEMNVRGVTRRGTGKLWHGDAEVLASAKTVISAKAIVPLYNWTPNLRAILKKLMDTHPGMNAAKGLMRAGPAQNIAAGKAMFARIRQESIQQMIQNGDLDAEAPAYAHDPATITALNVFENDVNKGISHANRMISQSVGKNRLKGQAWLKSANELMGEITYARAHWNDPALIETATRMRRELDRRYDRERKAGYRMRYDPGYAPGRYDGEFFNDDSVVFGEGRPTILGRLWRNAKTFRNYYEAIGDKDGPYIPMTRDSASIVGHRIRQGERAIQKKDWVESLKDYDDPVTGTPIAVPPKLDPVTKKLGSPNPNYELMYLRPGHDPIAVRKGYVRLIRQLTSSSFIEDWAPSRQVLEWGQRLKHTILLGDFFHLARLSYYGVSIMGLKAGHRKGLTALEFREADIPEAVRNGVIGAEEGRWATEKIPVRFGNLIQRMSRIDLMREFERGGLNIGRIQDAIYKDLVHNVPLLGRYNKWLFDRYTRGLMAQSAIMEFERMQKAKPLVMPEVLIRDISRDLNQFFGSIGRQGVFKSKGLQDLTRMIFLAPQWVEGLIDKEIVSSARVLGTPLSAMGIYRKGLTPLGTMGRGIGQGLVAMFAITQVLNFIFKRQSTFQNDPEHMFDAWLPSLEGEGKGFYLSPFAVFNELTHDLIRLGSQKPKFMDAVNQIGSNKLSPWGRMGLVLITSQTPTHQYITSSPELLATAGKQLVPVPISFGKIAQFGLHYAAPGIVPPAPPAALQRQALASFGLKIEPDIEAPLKVTRLAQEFVTKEYGRQETIHITPTTEASYPRLRNALRMKDFVGAQKIIRELQATKSDRQIIAAMKLDARHPFTGSKKYEKEFIGTLDPKGLDLYDKAVEQREREYQDFLNWFSNLAGR